MSERARGRFHSMYFKFRVQRTFAKKPETECLAKECYLKEDQLKLILQSFSALDENGDGKISKREIARAYKLAGFNPSKTDLEEIVGQHDANDDGYIDFAEYFQAMRVKMISVDFEEERLRTAFRVLDTNQMDSSHAKN
ncbi:uncharacterized protein LOC128549492 [Mercenaria mercenaria]|uniref:uncharacterized protein LOC128549492 n=1 Tax=Mercenaria mercenaria TaxID=6596 RepID=UPI00234EEBD9|nr:uncharacterized protein LOC128549492 [Mercenaria mercenaria]